MMNTTRSKLQWVKLLQAEIFWPGCVYESYSDALLHLHDVANLRNRKPALDPEDRVVYFFGVAENLKCGKSHGSTPNIQMCVIHVNDFIAVPWSSTGKFTPEVEFEEISRKYHINQGQLERTKQNYFLKTAIIEAQEYCTANSHQEAIKVFVSFLRKRQQKNQGKQKNIELCRKLDYIIEEEEKKDGKNQMEDVKDMDQYDDQAVVDDIVMIEEVENVDAEQVSSSNSANNDDGSSIHSLISSIAEKLWTKMLALGWEMMFQTGDAMLYKMPNTSFFDFKPNVNIFDSKEKACIKYVIDLLCNQGSDPEEQAFVCELLWPHMEAMGWISMKSNKEEWFMMPNTQFNQCIPNITIFASKAQALTKFLQPTSTSTSSGSSTQPQATHSSSDSEEEMDQEVICIDDDSDSAPADSSHISQRSHKKATSVSASTNFAKHKTKVSAYRPKAPKFFLKLGMLENELQSRGWYWKRGGKLGNYIYFHPETNKDAKLNDLIEGFHYFCGSENMIEYLEETGLYQEIETKLRIAYEEKYRVNSDSETEIYNRRPTLSTQKAKSSNVTTKSNTGIGRKKVRLESKKRPMPSFSSSSSSSSSVHQVRGSSKSTGRKPVTFGRIQAKLVSRGWTFRPGKFEYDYFAPGYTKLESVPNVNYFQSALLLENYLKEIGLWQELEQEIHEEEEERKNAIGTSSSKALPQKKLKSTTKNIQAKRKSCGSSVRAVIECNKAKLLEQEIILSSDCSYDEEDTEADDDDEEETALLSEEEKEKTIGSNKKEPLTKSSHNTAASTDAVVSPILAEFNKLMSTSTTIQKTSEIMANSVSTSSSTTTSVSSPMAKAHIQEDEKQQASSEKTQKNGEKESAKWNFYTPQRAHPAHHEVADDTTTAIAIDYDEVEDMEETQVLFDDRENKSNAISPDAPELKSISMNTAGSVEGEASSTPSSSSYVSVKESGHLARNIAASFTPSPPIVKKKAEQENQNKSCSINISELVDTAIKQLSSSFLDGSENATKSQNILLKYREHEYAQIQNFLQSSFQTNELKGSLYISGAPGCGKTALLRSAQGNILDLWKTQGHDEDDLQLIHLNAMALKDSNRLFGTLASTISGRKEFLASEMKNAFQFLEQAILFGCANEGQRNKTVLLVLDEMDIFLNKNTYCQDLYRLFQLAHKRPTTGKSTTSLILVGIANSIDLTERHLPHLRLHLGCTPKVIIFKAYSFQTIEKILIDRLGGLQVYTKLVSSHGVSFLARKLASTTGDIRTALDVTRRILQQRRGSHQGTKWEPVPLAEMVKSIKTSLEAKGSQTIQSLPRNLQMILFACIQLVQASSYFGGLANEVYPLDDLYRAYCDLTREAGIYQPLNCRDFRQALEVLSSEGLLEAQELKKNELIKLLFRPSEVVQMFRQDPFFARFSY